jgi:limonene-1,2-epoxide hydrolase
MVSSGGIMARQSSRDPTIVARSDRGRTRVGSEHEGAGGSAVAVTPAEQLVNAFMSTWHRGDIAEMIGFFAEDAVYHNIPMAPAVGKPAIRELLERFLVSMEGLEAEVHRQVARGNVVMNERTDRFSLGGRQIALQVCGVFEVDGDRITAWRDYFDMGVFSQ